MTARERMVAVMAADGRTVPETARALGLSKSQVEASRRKPEVRELAEKYGREGLSPEHTLELLMYDPNPRIRLDAAAKLAVVHRAVEPDATAPVEHPIQIINGCPNCTCPDCQKPPTDKVWQEAQDNDEPVQRTPAGITARVLKDRAGNKSVIAYVYPRRPEPDDA